jgi:di/tricarboxylate transporter
VSARVLPGSAAVGRTLRELGFRSRFGGVVVAIQRGGRHLAENLAGTVLREGDELLTIARPSRLRDEELLAHFEIAPLWGKTFQELRDHLFLVRVPAGSALVGATLEASRMGELTGITIAGILREDGAHLAAEPSERLQAGDRLLASGGPDRIRSLLELRDVEIQTDVSEAVIESDDVGVVEVTLAPRSRAAGKTLAELDFREKLGLQVLAVWREGAAVRSSLASLPLHFGDALLVQGPWPRIRLLGTDPDYVVLAQAAQVPRRTRKAPFALGALGLMIAFVVSGYQPIHVAAFAAATAVVLTGAITMEEAYRTVEWRAVFLVAAILPVGIAMERTGAAQLASQAVTDLAGPMGPYAVLAGLLCLSSLLSQCLDGAPAVVLLTPVALGTAEQLGLSPYPVMMGVGLAASAAFMTPFSHKANLIVMGAGGYRVGDYLRVGSLLTVVLLALLVALIPVFFPFG